MVFLAPEARYQPKMCFSKLMPLFHCTCSLVPYSLLQPLNILFIKFFHMTNIILWGPYVVHSSTLWARKGEYGFKDIYLSQLLHLCLFSLHFTPTKFNIKRKSWSFLLYMAEISQGSKIPTPYSLLPLIEKDREASIFLWSLCKALNLEIYWFYIYLP